MRKEPSTHSITIMIQCSRLHFWGTCSLVVDHLHFTAHWSVSHFAWDYRKAHGWFDIDPMQLVDELSMIYTACLMCYATFSFSQSRTVKLSLASGLILLAAFITVCHSNQISPSHWQVSAILSLPTRSTLSRERICPSGRHQSIPRYVCHGNQHST